MVELRKRPAPKEPPAPAPAAKKRASGPKAKPATKNGSVASKAKAAASKIKAAVAGPSSNEEANKQATVEDEAAVEKGEGGMIPETAGTAPSTTTVPGTGAEPASAKSSLPITQSPNEADGVKNKAASLGLTNASATEDADGAATTAELENPTSTNPPLSASSVGKQIASLSTFGGTIETHTGQKVSVSELLSQPSTGGIIIFTYPKASTPGCTQQACSFRDSYTEFTGSIPSSDKNYQIYGLSMDSTKANTTFATKQNLQYPLLCDPDASLVGAIGMRKPGMAKATSRGVVVIDAAGTVKLWFQGGPQKTVDAVREYLGDLK